MTVTAIHTRNRTAEAVDFAALTEWELRVIFYAADYQRTRDEMMSPIGGNIAHMAAAITAVIDRYGFDLIREVGALAGHAMITRNYQMQADLFPDSNRWRWTETLAGVFQRGIASTPPFLTVYAITQRWHAALNGHTAVAEAVA